MIGTRGKRILPLPLTDIEVRVLGALIEKDMTTPEYYPLSLNALVNACNQKSNRSPIVGYDEPTVARVIEGLREATSPSADRKGSSGAKVPPLGLGDAWSRSSRDGGRRRADAARTAVCR